MVPYGIDEHRHRFAAWAAGRAASATVGGRFKGKLAKAILEESGVSTLISSPGLLPVPGAIDAQHRQWREAVVAAANRHGQHFTHGVAAKLINIYFKTAFVCGGHHESERVKALHPPIDAQLLKELGKKDVGGQRKYWQRALTGGWTTFSSDQYEDLITTLRTAMRGKPMWMAEEHWCGFQQ